MYYASLEFPGLKLKQDSTIIVHKDAMFFSLKMSVNLNQYRGIIGYLMSVSSLRSNLKTEQFLDSTTCVTQIKYLKTFTFFQYCCFLFYYIISVKKIQNLTRLYRCNFLLNKYTVLWLCKLKIFLSGHIETNSGPVQKNQNKSFSICHWNLNCMTAHGYAKVSRLKAYITARKMDIICLSETYLNSTIQPDNGKLEIPDTLSKCPDEIRSGGFPGQQLC